MVLSLIKYGIYVRLYKISYLASWNTDLEKDQSFYYVHYNLQHYVYCN